MLHACLVVLLCVGMKRCMLALLEQPWWWSMHAAPVHRSLRTASAAAWLAACSTPWQPQLKGGREGGRASPHHGVVYHIIVWCPPLTSQPAPCHALLHHLLHGERHGELLQCALARQPVRHCTHPAGPGRGRAACSRMRLKHVSTRRGACPPAHGQAAASAAHAYTCASPAGPHAPSAFLRQVHRGAHADSARMPTVAGAVAAGAWLRSV